MIAGQVVALRAVHGSESASDVGVHGAVRSDQPVRRRCAWSVDQYRAAAAERQRSRRARCRLVGRVHPRCVVLIPGRSGRHCGPSFGHSRHRRSLPTAPILLPGHGLTALGVMIASTARGVVLVTASRRSAGDGAGARPLVGTP